MKKTILKISLTCLIVRVVLFCTTFGAVCAENTTTTQTLQQVMQNGNVYDLMSYVSRKYASFPDYWGGSPITGWSYDAYADWLEEKGLSSQLQENVTITEGASGGRSYNIPQDLRETMVQYVQETYINQNPLSYTQCYIYSYNFLDPSTFNNIAPYNSLKNFISSQDGYVLVNYGNFKTASSEQGYMIYVIPKSLNMGLYGTVSGGSFSNVQMSINWLSSQYLNQMSSEIKAYYMNQSGSITEGVQSFNAWQVKSIKNNNTLSFNSTNLQFTMFTNLPKNEPIYVFQTLNAYKNYNAGVGQAYYLPTGSTLTVPYNDPFTDTDLQNAGSYYNNIVDNSQTGWTADQVLTLVDKILGVGGSGGSNNAGTGNNDDSFSLGFLGKIGEVLTSVTGAINPVQDLVEDGIKKFLEDIFGWLPPEIVTLWIAGITFAVFFGILRVIRG